MRKTNVKRRRFLQGILGTGVAAALPLKLTRAPACPPISNYGSQQLPRDEGYTVDINSDGCITGFGLGSPPNIFSLNADKFVLQDSQGRILAESIKQAPWLLEAEF